MAKRFDVVASNNELVVTEDKTAIRIELQYGKDGEPTELVIAELYRKDDTWAYTRSQVRVNCTTDNCKYLLESIKSMHEASKKVVKTEKTSKVEKAIDTMTVEERLALIKALTESVKAEPTKKSTKKTDNVELVLESALLNRKRK